MPDALETANRRLNSLSIKPGSNGNSGINVSQELYYYPPEVELRIITLATCGQVDELKEIVESIRIENLTNRNLSIRMLTLLAKELEGTVFKILNRVTCSVPAKGEVQPSLRDEIQSQLAGILENSKLIAAQGKQNHRFKKPIAEYITKHYMKRETSLKQVALEFNLSEVYLSKLWREFFGTNFFTYIEELRINQACKLLKSGKMTVDQVTYTVGYSSAHVFRRAFKRTMGVSPSTYR